VVYTKVCISDFFKAINGTANLCDILLEKLQTYRVLKVVSGNVALHQSTV
jgi:hypothetical protein